MIRHQWSLTVVIAVGLIGMHHLAHVHTGHAGHSHPAPIEVIPVAVTSTVVSHAACCDPMDMAGHFCLVVLTALAVLIAAVTLIQQISIRSRSRRLTTRMIMTLVAAAALTAGAALGGCGSNATAPSASPASSAQVAQDHNQADISFAQGMIPHHAQAIAMSEMAAQRAGSSEVKNRAARIQAAQQPEIDQMSGFLRAWNAPVPSAKMPMGQMDHGAGGAMPGMMFGDQMQQLRQASGAAFELMFLEMMISHHQGAVAMAETELRDGQNPEARQLAQRIIDDQQREIVEMQEILGV